MPRRYDAQLRHAAHYERVLRQAKEFYKQGHNGVLRGLALFDLEWVNIQVGQSWATEYATADDDAAALCSDYPDAGAHLLNLRQHPRENIRWREAALLSAQRLKRRDAEGYHLGNLGFAYAALGDSRRAIEFFEQHLIIAREISASSRSETERTAARLGEGQALGNLGNAFKNLGDARRAIEFFEQALIIDREISAASRSEAERTAARRGEGADLGGLGLAYTALGDARRAIKFYEQALVIDREIGDLEGAGSTLNNLGNAYADLGDSRRAIEFFGQALAIARKIGNRRGEGQALGNLGAAHADLGDARRAIEFFEQSLIIARDIGSLRGEGDARRAIEFFKQVLAIVREIGDRGGEGQTLGNLGLAYATLGDARRAIEFYEQQLVIARDIDDRRGQGTVLWNMSLELDKLGDRAQAMAYAEAALSVREQIEDPRAEKVRRQLAQWRNDSTR